VHQEKDTGFGRSPHTGMGFQSAPVNCDPTFVEQHFGTTGGTSRERAEREDPKLSSEEASKRPSRGAKYQR